MKPVELILERAEGVRRVGSGWMVSCPLQVLGRGFGDRNPSVSVTEGDDSRALVNARPGAHDDETNSKEDSASDDIFQ